LKKEQQYALNIVINLRKKQLDGLVIYKYSAATSTQASSTSTSTGVQLEYKYYISVLLSDSLSKIVAAGQLITWSS